FPSLLRSKQWTRAVPIIQRHGTWGLALISLSPVPQHAAVAIAGLVHLPSPKVFLAVLAGRIPKYLLISWGSIKIPENSSRPRRWISKILLPRRARLWKWRGRRGRSHRS